MFGNNGGLLGNLFGGSRQPTYTNQNRGGLLNNPLARMALIAGVGWLGKRWLDSRRSQPQNYSQFNPDQSAASINSGSSLGSWDTPSQTNGIDSSTGQTW